MKELQADLDSANIKVNVTGRTGDRNLIRNSGQYWKSNGPDLKNNGILLRRDIHYLFDSGNLRIDVNGNIFISQSALEDYGRSIPDHIDIPDYVNKDYIRWRWENYDGE